MPVAAFIIVVMGLLAAGMARVGSQTSVAGAQEQVSVQTFYAAETGAQYGMNQIFFATGGDRSGADSACATVDGTVLNLDAAGMRNCSATIACGLEVDSSSGIATSFYTINSAAECGASPVWAQRTVEVSAYLQ